MWKGRVFIWKVEGIRAGTFERRLSESRIGLKRKVGSREDFDDELTEQERARAKAKSKADEALEGLFAGSGDSKRTDLPSSSIQGLVPAGGFGDVDLGMSEDLATIIDMEVVAV